jgi:hypothetical protein
MPIGIGIRKELTAMTVGELTRILNACPQDYVVCLGGRGTEPVCSIVVVNNEKTTYTATQAQKIVSGYAVPEDVKPLRKQFVVLSAHLSEDRVDDAGDAEGR